MRRVSAGTLWPRPNSPRFKKRCIIIFCKSSALISHVAIKAFAQACDVISFCILSLFAIAVRSICLGLGAVAMSACDCALSLRGFSGIVCHVEWGAPRGYVCILCFSMFGNLPFLRRVILTVRVHMSGQDFQRRDAAT